MRIQTAWQSDLERSVGEHLERAGPRPEVSPIHMIADPTWPDGAQSLCEIGTHGGQRPPEHGWHFYTDRPPLVDCDDCLEWMHA